MTIEKRGDLPYIQTVSDARSSNPNSELFHDAIRNALKVILPKNFSFKCVGNQSAQELRNKFHAHLPLLTNICGAHPPCSMSFYVLSKYRQNSFKFFLDMVSRWLVPGKRLNVLLIYASDFRMPEFSEEIYTVCEVMIQIETRDEYEEIMRNLPIIDTELRLGIPSSFYARRILEIKGLSADEKTALIQEQIAYLISRLPGIFDYDVLTEMQHVLVICRDEFKAPRDSKHLSRIIGTQYLFRKAIQKAVAIYPQKRHLNLRIFRTRVSEGGVEKKVLGILVAVNFLRNKEVLEETHLLKAIQNYIPNVGQVENSFFSNQRSSEQVCTLYIEVEKLDGQEFNSDEIRLLKRELPSDLKDRIEHLMHPVFMPSNEEEIIRNILTLSSQIKYLRDIPQVVTTFHEQTHANLFFTIVLVRLLKPGMPSLQELFRNSDTFLEYFHDRCQLAGSLRRKYKKEATVFRVKLSKEEFLRADHSIDLNKARQAVVKELGKIVGEIRDYNGGMILKQNELLSEVQKGLSDQDIKYNDLLLENFFYSLTPVIMRSLLEPRALQKLYLMMIDAMDQGFIKGKNHYVQICIEERFAFFMLKIEDRSIKEELSRTILKMQLHSSELANSYVSLYDMFYFGYVYRTNDPIKQQNFCQALETVLEEWEEARMQECTNSMMERLETPYN